MNEELSWVNPSLEVEKDAGGYLVFTPNEDTSNIEEWEQVGKSKLALGDFVAIPKV